MKQGSTPQQIDWQSSYNTGIDRIDRQHRGLVNIINLLINLESQERGRQSEFWSLAQHQLSDYLKEHLSYEESLMDRYDYPERAAHKQKHIEGTEYLRKLSDAGDRKALLRYLREWLITHVLGSDMQYVEHIRAGIMRDQPQPQLQPQLQKDPQCMPLRILVIDDELEVLQNYRSILEQSGSKRRERIQRGLFSTVKHTTEEDSGAGQGAADQADITFELTLARQGEEGVVLADAAMGAGSPFMVAFIDMRMPPGIDGLETASRLRAIDDRIYIVFVSAHSDRSIDELGHCLNHDVLYLRKPFISDEILQLARSQGRSWHRDRELEASVSRAELELAYHGGVAEISAQIFHNFGNALTGVDFLVQKLFDARIKALDLVRFLQQQQVKQESGERVATFLDLATLFEGFQKRFLDLDHLKLISSRVGYMSEVLEQQREMTKDKDPFWYSHFDIGEMLDHAVSIVRSQLDHLSIALDLQVGDPGEVELPKNPLLQMVVSLLKNAIEAIELRHQQRLEADEWSEKRILLSARHPNNRSGVLEIVVEDNGVGLREVRPIEQIFAPGFSTKKGGTGQGLHTASNFIQSVGGEIEVTEPEDERGARFLVTLPLVRVE